MASDDYALQAPAIDNVDDAHVLAALVPPSAEDAPAEAPCMADCDDAAVWRVSPAFRINAEYYSHLIGRTYCTFHAPSYAVLAPVAPMAVRIPERATLAEPSRAYAVEHSAGEHAEYAVIDCGACVREHAELGIGIARECRTCGDADASVDGECPVCADYGADE
jgi:hypothetical protein